jgi:UDP-N-acetylmuramoyl-tripeptide--D-alanyl-D-alanine ligase
MSMAIPITRVVEATGGTLKPRGDDPPLTFESVSIDSRAIMRGALFFAIKGDRFDGHDYVQDAFNAGARGAVVRRGFNCPGTIEVDDTVKALGDLARAHRLSLGNLKVVAVTGSQGKTTTKEMCAAILSAHAGADAVSKTEGNLNNHLGVPLTLLRLEERHRFAVVEMGMSGVGEIAYLTELARPDVAVVVNVAPVHLQQLGSIENIARAKAEIFGSLGENGVAIVPSDEPLLLPYLEKLRKVVRFTPPKDVAMDATGLSFALEAVEVKVPLVGKHNAINAAAAAAVARALDVPEKAIVDGLAAVKPAKHRAQLVRLSKYTILDDCYNAAPPSMRAALDALVELTPKGAQRVAVLGDMLELGNDSARFHMEIGAYAADRVDYLITIGEAARGIDEGAKKLGDHRAHVRAASFAAKHVSQVAKEGSVVLVKASRGMKLEQVIDTLVNDEANGASRGRREPMANGLPGSEGKPR